MSLANNGGFSGPSGVSVVQNVQYIKNYAEQYGKEAAIAEAYDKLKGGGDWDYRQQGEDLGLGVTAWQDLGNYNFGAVMASLGLGLYITENIGGIYQIWREKEGEGIPVIWDPYGDDPADNKAIEQE